MFLLIVFLLKSVLCDVKIYADNTGSDSDTCGATKGFYCLG
jgi:hypothetical protein